MCGFKRVGSMIARDGVGVRVTQMGQSSNSMELGFAPVHPHPLPQVRVFSFERMVKTHAFFLVLLT
jgi:hypothetical protein